MRLSNSPTPAAIPVAQSKSPSKRSSPAIWILAALLVVLAGVAGKQRGAALRSGETIPQLPHSLVPVPPAFAFEKSVKPAAIEKPKEKEPAAADSPESQPPEAVPQAVSAAAVPAAPVQANAKPAVPTAPVLQPQTATTPGQAVSPAEERTPYLLIGRYEREDRAQASAKKIEDLGLPVVVLPRRNLTGNFFVVLSGPFAPKKLQGAIEQLETAGFSNIHPVKNLQAKPGANP
jgi:hypothetical protein